jgi:hypothetical protein
MFLIIISASQNQNDIIHALSSRITDIRINPLCQCIAYERLLIVASSLILIVLLDIRSVGMENVMHMIILLP